MKKKQPTQFSRINYIKTKARTLPIHKCYLNTNWQLTGISDIIVTRKHTNGNYTIGQYRVDTLGIGLQNTIGRFNESKEFLKQLITELTSDETEDNIYLEVDYALVHNIIYGAIAFAEERSFKPHKEFSYTQYILEEDDENIELMDIEFGVDGQHQIILYGTQEEVDKHIRLHGDNPIVLKGHRHDLKED